MFISKRTGGILAAGFGLSLLGATALMQAPEKLEKHSVIVQGANLNAVKLAVQSVGGEISHELRIIKAVGTDLTDAQMAKLRSLEGIRKVYANSGVNTSTIEEPGCAVSGNAEVKFAGGDKVEWEFTNISDVDIHQAG